VEDGEDTGRAADSGAIGGEGLDGGGGLVQEGGIDDLRLDLGDGAEGCRQGEGEEVVITGEESRARAREPVLGAVLLTRGAVAVAAGVVPILERATDITAREGSAEGWGAARGSIA
jgi:autotransporter adhesin